MAKQKTQPTPYLRYSTLTIVAFYGIFAGLLAISAVLEAISWDMVQEWLVKIGLVALILMVLSAFVGLVVTSANKK